ncbi:MAG: prepilin-type N-terminal cleavage/methylation domain-containing protein [Gemmatimonadetes bacterium]|nr:prepilin-type N-terminal cleavage/methylation domain-containing protein [Gemmatimonadota bacterium]
MQDKRAGFTIIELVIALMIGSILTSIALSSFGNSTARFSVSGARNAFVSLHARARASAIERGTTATLFIDLGADTAAVVRQDTVIARIDFMKEFNVNLSNSNTRLLLCMSPRGYADDGCTSFSAAQTLRFIFRNSSDTVSVDLLPLGQLIW